MVGRLLSVLTTLVALAVSCKAHPVQETRLPSPVVTLAETGGNFSAALERLSGGGTLYVPPGVWTTGPVNLTSGLTLYLAANATIKAVPSEDWPLLPPLSIYGVGHDHPGPRYAPFIGGWGVKKLTITGENGTIDGSGEFWWKRQDTETHTVS